MMVIIGYILQQEVIIGLAVLGAIIATVGSYMIRKSERNNNQGLRKAQRVSKVGYYITWGSIALFIVAGFYNGWGSGS